MRALRAKSGKACGNGKVSLKFATMVPRSSFGMPKDSRTSKVPDLSEAFSTQSIGSA